MNNPVKKNSYKADSQLLIIIINLVFRLKRDCYICDVFLLLYSGYMYNRFSADISFFAFTEAVMIVLLGFVQYIILASKSRFINKTAVDVEVSADQILIKTAGFNGPLWFKKESIDLTFNRAEVVVQQIVNPYPLIFKESKQIMRLRYRDKDAYVIGAYFSEVLEQELGIKNSTITLQ